MKDNKVWIFLSHSHLDIEIVRKIRNNFEEIGFEPIMFYLKCLNDNDEIEDLIEREIKARQWFVLVDSKNSRKSKWVKSELNIINELNDKKVFTINTENFEDDLNKIIQSQVDSIAKNMTVFISYSYSDSVIATELRNRLINQEYKVFIDTDILPGSNWIDLINTKLDEAINNGFVLLLLSKESLKSKIVRMQIEYASKKEGAIIPIIIGDLNLNDYPELKNLVNNTIHIKISENLTDRDYDKIISTLETFRKRSTDINFYNTSDLS